MDHFVAVIAIFCTIGLPVLAAIVLLSQLMRGRHQERLEQIRQGGFLAEPEKPERKPNRYPALRNGLFMLGLAVGLGVGALMGPVFVLGYAGIDLTVPVMTLFGGGLAFMLYFFLSRAIMKKEQAQDAM